MLLKELDQDNSSWGNPAGRAPLLLRLKSRVSARQRHERHREGPAAPAVAGQGLLDAVLEQHAVREVLDTPHA